MPFVPALPPQPVWIQQSHAVATVDSPRHYLYGAIGSSGIAVVNTTTGDEVSQLGNVVADLVVDSGNGDVYCTDGNGHYVVRMLPGLKFNMAKNAKNYVELPGPSRHLALDSALHRLYVAEFGEKATRVFVVDTTTMSQVGTITTPVNEFGNISVDPESHEVYIAQMDTPRDYLVADAHSLQVTRTVPNEEGRSDSQIVLNPTLRHVYRVDFSGKISTYDYSGRRLGQSDLSFRLRQCDVDASKQALYCWAYHLDPQTFQASQNRLVALRDDGQGALTQADTLEHDFIGDTLDAADGVVWMITNRGGNSFAESFRLP